MPSTGILARPEIRNYVISACLSALAENALSVLLGIHIYEVTRQVAWLGWLGLSEAIPAVGLVLVGGYVADRISRRDLGAASRIAMMLVTAALVFLPTGHEVPALLTACFLAAVCRAFDNPATSGLEAQILPTDRVIEAITVIATATRTATLVGPVLAGFVYAWAGPRVSYAIVTICLALSAGWLWAGVKQRQPPPQTTKISMLASIGEGLRFVFTRQVIVGSMALDLFSVFFGGVVGLLPVFAIDILHTGPAGVGVLRAAGSVGSIACMLIATRHPPRERSGGVLFGSIAGFGVAIIVFALSRNLILSIAALAFAGACDGISTVIRRAIVRVAAPDHLRGRVSAVRMLFVNSSNELGTFESGMAATWLGPVAAAWSGGVITLIVVVATALLAPELRRLNIAQAEAENQAAAEIPA